MQFSVFLLQLRPAQHEYCHTYAAVAFVKRTYIRIHVGRAFSEGRDTRKYSTSCSIRFNLPIVSVFYLNYKDRKLVSLHTVARFSGL